MKTIQVIIYFVAVFVGLSVLDNWTTVVLINRGVGMELNVALPHDLHSYGISRLLLRDCLLCVPIALCLGLGWHNRNRLSPTSDELTLKKYADGLSKPRSLPVFAALLLPFSVLLIKTIAVLSNAFLLLGWPSPYTAVIRFIAGLTGMSPRSTHVVMTGVMGVIAYLLFTPLLYRMETNRTKRCSATR